MPLKLIEEHVPTDAELLEAVRIRCAACFPALNIANSLAGSQTVPWKLIRQYSVIVLLAECKARKLDLSKEVTFGKLVTDSKVYQAYQDYRDEITED